MPKCKRCPIKKECKTIGLHITDEKTKKRKSICPLIFMIERVVFPLLEKKEEGVEVVA